VHIHEDRLLRVSGGGLGLGEREPFQLCSGLNIRSILGESVLMLEMRTPLLCHRGGVFGALT
jgi:hypothetical protein